MPSPRPKDLFKHWTAEDKLKIIAVMADLIRDDIYAEKYGVVGRPNIQSIHELIAATPEALENERDSIESMYLAHPFSENKTN